MGVWGWYWAIFLPMLAVNIVMRSESSASLLNWMVGYFALMLVVAGFIALFKWMSPSRNRRTTHLDTKTCPFCAEDIKQAAIVCRFCGRDMPIPKPVDLSGFVSADDFARQNGLTTKEVEGRVFDGIYQGKRVGDKWFVHGSELKKVQG